MTATTLSLSPKVEHSGNVTIITFSGGKMQDSERIAGPELGSPTDKFSGRHLLLDFTHVESLSGLELGTLIALHKRVRTSGGRLTLFNLNADVYEVLSIVNLDCLLEICRQ